MAKLPQDENINPLVESIVREAERQAEEQRKEKEAAPMLRNEISDQSTSLNAIHDAHASVRRAKNLLTGVIATSLAVVAVSFATLSEGNSVLGFFGQKNLSANLTAQKSKLESVSSQNTSVSAAIAIMQAESLASRAVNINLESPDLLFSREQVSMLDLGRYAYTDSFGAVVELNDDSLNAKDATSRQQRESARTAIAGMQAELAKMSAATAPGELGKSIAAFKESVSGIKADESNFPSGATRQAMRSAQQAARVIVAKAPEATLQALIKDLNDQIAALQLEASDESTKLALDTASQALAGLSTKNPATFERAMKELAGISLSGVTDKDLHDRMAALFGQNPAVPSDLATAGMIANNLGRGTMIFDIANSRYNWTTIIDNVRTIARLGADMAPDSGAAYLDSRRDINPDGAQRITFTGFGTQADKKTIDIRGELLGTGDFNEKNFGLLSTYIDALEGSPVFQDVDGFTFSRSRNQNNEYTTPINITATLQPLGTTDARDAGIVSATEVQTTPAVKREAAPEAKPVEAEAAPAEEKPAEPAEPAAAESAETKPAEPAAEEKPAE